jgi:CheY-like chemotaxis protein
MKKARLLLVDDNHDNLEVLAVLLGERYAVFAYDSAPEALKAVTMVKPDVLVLDIGMPALDGVQCLRAVRSVPGYAHVPAVAVTAFAREVECREFVQAGFQAVVTKPVLDLCHLLNAIDSLLQPLLTAAAS